MVLIGDLQDTRNLDNLILRQLHVVFLKFHNEAIKQLGSNPPTITGLENLGSGTLFERAQRLVCWHYQWIIRHDFLPRILHTDVWSHQHRRPARLPESQGSYSVPIEFSLAAFRFGHSMVRNAYRVNCRQKRVFLGDLMARRARGVTHIRRLPDRMGNIPRRLAHVRSASIEQLHRHIGKRGHAWLISIYYPFVQQAGTARSLQSPHPNALARGSSRLALRPGSG